MTAAAAALPTATAGKSETKNLFHYGQNLTFYERDIPSSRSVDVIAELYDEVKDAANTIQVPHDQTTFRGISSSRFSYFDASEFNIMVQGLRGCTSIVVVSRLGKLPLVLSVIRHCLKLSIIGAYVTHFWEGPAFNINGPGATFTADVIGYLEYVAMSIFFHALGQLCVRICFKTAFPSQSALRCSCRGAQVVFLPCSGTSNE